MKQLLLAVLLGQALMDSAIAQNAQSNANSGFSFDVYGNLHHQPLPPPVG